MEIFKGEGVRHWYYMRLVGKNNETIVVSEGYYSRWGAKRAAKRVFPGIPVQNL